MCPCAATSARSRTTRSPGFERGGSARSARGQPRRQLLRPVAGVVLRRLSSHLRLPSWRLRRKPPAHAAVAARPSLSLPPLKRQSSRRLRRSRRFRAPALSTRPQRQRKQLVLPPRPPPLPRSRSARRTVATPQLRARPRQRHQSHRVQHHKPPHSLRQLRLLRHRHPLLRRRRLPAERPSVRARVQWFRARRVRAQSRLGLRSLRRVRLRRLRPAQQQVSPVRAAMTGRVRTSEAVAEERRASEDRSIRKPYRRAFRAR